MKSFLTFLSFLFLSAFSYAQDLKDFTQFVNPFIGTDGHGHCYPGATVPFGMIQLSPSTDVNGRWDWYGGYHYTDKVLKGFAHTHTSGTGIAGLGDILLMPMQGKQTVKAGTDEQPETGIRSRFSHETEKAFPGYYKVHLDDYNIDVELTATSRTGFHRYTFRNSGEGSVVIDPTHVIGIDKFPKYITISDFLLDTEIEVVSNTEVRGMKHNYGASGDRKTYFVAYFSKPFKKAQIAVDDVLFDRIKLTKSNNVKALVNFDVAKDEAIEVRVGLSFVSYEGAQKNYEAEAKGKTFDETVEVAKNTWNKKLSKTEVSGGTLSQRRIFYTALYHTLLSPTIINDVDGNFFLEGKVYNDTVTQYSNFSLWDTFRAQNPLLTIIEPDMTRQIVHSFYTRYAVAGVDLPFWEMVGFDNMVMPGYWSVAIMYDAIVKEIPGIDAESIYNSFKSVAENQLKNGKFCEGSVVKQIKENGFPTAELNQSVTHTMEYSYLDWCIYELAKRLNKAEDTAYFHKRSLAFQHIYRAEKGYFWPRMPNGNWVEFDDRNWEQLNKHYISGNIWAYSSFLMQDVPYLIKVRGGKEGLAKWIDDLRADNTPMNGNVHMDISGFIGKYGHGDEPSHHIPFLYNYAGKSWKTQQFVREVLDSMYHDAPLGLENNEDYGQMSAWYVMSSMGFYSFCPGKPEYTLCSPLFDKVAIHLDNGQTFTISTENNSKKNQYIQKAAINGKLQKDFILNHKTILEGGELKFEMGEKPNKKLWK